ncbi:dbp-2 [Erannis ankeraria nucleopolyhedrovirus]|uniref:dbp-2 n=1 Tax=Erannis ankeraria nucleopolyhedrovirus TaxID=2913600 RepID=UPI00117B7BE1|nr:dbp-2 [Erannis ankeraria nucleopolyhedrovirus]UJZ88977.1 dbp-2 [Erannis ankeraria nucleopolyhedrovirus]
MSKRSHSQAIIDDDDKQIVCVNNEVSELKEESCDKMLIPADDPMILIFKSRSKQTGNNQTWIQELNYNLSMGNPTVVYSDTIDNDLENILMFINSSLNFDKWQDQLYPIPHENISIDKAKAPRIVNQVGLLVKGGLLQFYFYDEVTLRLCVGKHGPFFVASWSKMSIHNKIMSNFIMLYNRWKDGEMVKMQDHVFLNVPLNKDDAKKNFVKQFYDIYKENNKDVYEKGIRGSRTQVKCDMFDAARFDEVFDYKGDDASSSFCSPDIKMTMFALIEGYKVGKEQEMETVHNQKTTVKSYSLAVTPKCFFHIES